MDIEVEIANQDFTDPIGEAYNLVLKEKNGERFVPVVIVLSYADIINIGCVKSCKIQVKMNRRAAQREGRFLEDDKGTIPLSSPFVI